jgi:diguanylate cyclase (GGDEF)-like protein
LLRQEPLYSRIPIVFVSTEDDKFKQLSALSLGGDDFLTKPIWPQHLIATVTSRAKRANILNFYMNTDSLTGLLNHANILQRLEIEVARARRENIPLSFIMIDLDHFKKINDRYGHPVGDQVLRKLSALLLSRFRKIDLIGRYGGEEFAVVLPNTNIAASLKICEGLREKFCQFIFNVNNSTFFATFSAGIASFPSVKDAPRLIVAADQALYKAKDNGRNQVMCFNAELDTFGM